MGQFLRPDGVISNSGFTPTSGTLNSTIDETSASDADYNTASAANSSFEVSLSNATDPASSTGHTGRFRACYFGGGTRSITATLKQGSTTIASYSPTITSSFALYIFTLSGAEADAITNYNDLRMHFTSGAAAMGIETEVQISWAELEIPDAPAGGGSVKKKTMFIMHHLEYRNFEDWKSSMLNMRQAA